MRVLILLALIAGISADCHFHYDHFKQTYVNFYKHAHEWDMDHFKTELKTFHDEFECFYKMFNHKFDFYEHLDLEHKNIYFNHDNMKCMKTIKEDVFKCDAHKYDDKHYDFCNDDVDHKFLDCIKHAGEGKCDHFDDFYNMATYAFKYSKDHKWCKGSHLFYGITAFVH